MKNKDKLILIEIICEKQLRMLKDNPKLSESKEYIDLERIKAKLKYRRVIT